MEDKIRVLRSGPDSLSYIQRKQVSENMQAQTQEKTTSE